MAMAPAMAGSPVIASSREVCRGLPDTRDSRPANTSTTDRIRSGPVCAASASAAAPSRSPRLMSSVMSPTRADSRARPRRERRAVGGDGFVGTSARALNLRAHELREVPELPVLRLRARSRAVRARDRAVRASRGIARRGRAPPPPSRKLHRGLVVADDLELLGRRHAAAQPLLLGHERVGEVEPRVAGHRRSARGMNSSAFSGMNRPSSAVASVKNHQHSKSSAPSGCSRGRETRRAAVRLPRARSRCRCAVPPAPSPARRPPWRSNRAGHGLSDSRNDRTMLARSSDWANVLCTDA